MFNSFLRGKIKLKIMTPKKVITLHKMLLDLKIKSLEDRLSPKSDIKKQLINIIKIK